MSDITLYLEIIRQVSDNTPAQGAIATEENRMSLFPAILLSRNVSFFAQIVATKPLPSLGVSLPVENHPHP
jgi:hypothetical protein